MQRTCGTCKERRVIQKDESGLCKPYNVLCERHDTVEPVVSFYYTGKRECFGEIPAPPCYAKK
jgi:hypothetical protein